MSQQPPLLWIHPVTGGASKTNGWHSYPLVPADSRGFCKLLKANAGHTLTFFFLNDLKGMQLERLSWATEIVSMAKWTKKPSILDSALPSDTGMVRFSEWFYSFNSFHLLPWAEVKKLCVMRTTLHLKREFLLIYIFPFPTLQLQKISLIHTWCENWQSTYSRTFLISPGALISPCQGWRTQMPAGLTLILFCIPTNYKGVLREIIISNSLTISPIRCNIKAWIFTICSLINGPHTGSCSGSFFKDLSTTI